MRDALPVVQLVINSTEVEPDVTCTASIFDAQRQLSDTKSLTFSVIEVFPPAEVCAGCSDSILHMMPVLLRCCVPLHSGNQTAALNRKSWGPLKGSVSMVRDASTASLPDVLLVTPYAVLRLNASTPVYLS